MTPVAPASFASISADASNLHHAIGKDQPPVPGAPMRAGRFFLFAGFEDPAEPLPVFYPVMPDMPVVNISMIGPYSVRKVSMGGPTISGTMRKN